MEWLKLDLAKASLLKKEVDTVLARLAEIILNPGDIDKTALINTVQTRIQELETFYLKNSDDERAILFEKERLRLRKALQPFYGTAAKDNRSLAASEVHDRSSAHDSATSRGQDRLSISQLSKTSKPAISFKTQRSPVGKSPASAAASQRSQTSVNGKIYAWEDRPGKGPRGPIELCGVVFQPTLQPGFYSRAMSRDDESDFSSDRFIDLQIVLTQEELATLAARKKIDRPDVKLIKNEAASKSVHSSVPYVDPRRIKQDMLRPGHPDRWVGAQGFAR
eukprot:gene2144-2339_t